MLIYATDQALPKIFQKNASAYRQLEEVGDPDALVTTQGRRRTGSEMG